MSYLNSLRPTPLIRRRQTVSTMSPTTGSLPPQEDATAEDFGTPSGNTPGAAALKRRMALTLLENGTSTAPVGHWTQAAARVAQGGLGGLQASDANEMEAAGRRESTMRLARVFNTGKDGRISGEANAALLTDPWATSTGTTGRRGALSTGKAPTSATERMVQRLMDDNPEMSFEDAIGRVRRAPPDDTMSRERLAVQAMREGAFDTLEDARRSYGLPAAPTNEPDTPPPMQLGGPDEQPDPRPTLGGGRIGASAQHQDMLVKAQDAIARGAPREAVLQRLQEMGVDVSGL